MTFMLIIIIVVPNIPQVQIVPTYSNDSQVLKKLYIVTTMNQTVSAINNIINNHLQLQTSVYIYNSDCADIWIMAHFTIL